MVALCKACHLRSVKEGNGVVTCGLRLEERSTLCEINELWGVQV
jgi:hypothetical protein